MGSPLDTDELFARMLQSLPPFVGTDPNTSAHWYCKTCYERADEANGRRLRACSRCKLVYYCNVSCQREDFSAHKEQCKQLHEYSAQLRHHTQQLRCYSDSFMFETNEQPFDFFEQHTGRFWLHMETRDYCRTRHSLASEMEDLAHNYEVAPLLEKVLNHRLELLRLITSDNLGLRNVVPFTFLRLNQDSRCAAFITHWIRRIADPQDPITVQSMHMNSARGDWLYGTADPYADVFETVPEADPNTAPISMLMALCIIKLRIIAKLEADKKQLSLFAATRGGQALGDSVAHVGRALVGDTAHVQRVALQETLVERYFDLIHAQNPTLLPSVINPGPLKSSEAPPFMSPGGPSEAYYLLMDCNRLFVRVPGAEQRLKARFGDSPQYSCDMYP